MFSTQGVVNKSFVHRYIECWGAYKSVDRKIRPVKGTLPEETRTKRNLPEDPLLSLKSVPTHPPDFVPTAKMTEERIKKLDINKSGFLWPEEAKLLLHVLCMNEKSIAFVESEKGRFRSDYFSPYVIPTVRMAVVQ